MGHSMRSIAHSPDGRHANSGSNDKTIESGTPTLGLPLTSLWRGIMFIAFSPNARRITSRSTEAHPNLECPEWYCVRQGIIASQHPLLTLLTGTTLYLDLLMVYKNDFTYIRLPF